MNEEFPILIAEDDENDAIILERALRKVGFENPIRFCRDGAEVLDYLQGEGQFQNRKQYPFPSLLITDLKMPKLGGIEILKWLYHHPDCNLIPKIVFTASKQASDVQEAYKWGANSYLVKPGGYEQLTQMLEVFFEYWNMCEKPSLPGKC